MCETFVPNLTRVSLEPLNVEQQLRRRTGVYTERDAGRAIPRQTMAALEEKKKDLGQHSSRISAILRMQRKSGTAKDNAAVQLLRDSKRRKHAPSSPPVNERTNGARVTTVDAAGIGLQQLSDANYSYSSEWDDDDSRYESVEGEEQQESASEGGSHRAAAALYSAEEQQEDSDNIIVDEERRGLRAIPDVRVNVDSATAPSATTGRAPEPLVGFATPMWRQALVLSRSVTVRP